MVRMVPELTRSWWGWCENSPDDGEDGARTHQKINTRPKNFSKERVFDTAINLRKIGVRGGYFVEVTFATSQIY